MNMLELLIRDFTIGIIIIIVTHGIFLLCLEHKDNLKKLLQSLLNLYA